MDDFDTGIVGNLGPDVAGAPRPCPVIASLLTGYGDEAKIADRCANSLGIALDDNDLLAFSGCGKRGRKPAPTTKRSYVFFIWVLSSPKHISCHG
jgi:hypothetical protein